MMARKIFPFEAHQWVTQVIQARAVRRSSCWNIYDLGRSEKCHYINENVTLLTSTLLLTQKDLQ